MSVYIEGLRKRQNKISRSNIYTIVVVQNGKCEKIVFLKKRMFYRFLKITAFLTRWLHLVYTKINTTTRLSVAELVERLIFIIQELLFVKNQFASTIW